MNETLRHPKALRRYNRSCEYGGGENESILTEEELTTESQKLINLSDLKIYCRKRHPQSTILPLEIVLAEKQQEYKEQMKAIFNQRKRDQFKRYLELLSQPDQITSQWINYGRKHIDEISVLSKSFYLSHSM